MYCFVSQLEFYFISIQIHSLKTSHKPLELKFFFFFSLLLLFISCLNLTHSLGSRCNNVIFIIVDLPLISFQFCAVVSCSLLVVLEDFSNMIWMSVVEQKQIKILFKKFHKRFYAEKLFLIADFCLKEQLETIIFISFRLFWFYLVIRKNKKKKNGNLFEVVGIIYFKFFVFGVRVLKK